MSEAGQIDFPPETVLRRGRVEAGGMIYLNHDEGRIYETDEALLKLAKAQDYSSLLKEAQINIDNLPNCSETDPADAATRYTGDLNRFARYVGYTLNQESFKFLMDPMLKVGVEKVSAMGYGNAINALSDHEGGVAKYFSQRFAQVTNPPLDSPESIIFINKKAENAPIHIHPIGAVSIGQDGKDITEMGLMHKEGAVAFSDDGLPIQDGAVMRIALEYSKLIDVPIINHAEDDAILINTDFIPIIDKIKGKFTRPIKIIVAGSETINIEFEDQKVSTYNYDSFFQNYDANFNFEDFDENTVATKFYTTGTTGDPKGVSYTHRQLVLHSLGFIAGSSVSNYSHRFHNEDVYMPLTPMFHVHGWGFPYMATLLGVKQIYPSKYEPEKLLKLIKKEIICLIASCLIKP
mgnify:CR=1 FL=1